MKSMTGFGKAERITKYGRYAVEIKSLNHRFLNIDIKLPREFQSLEIELRSLVPLYIYRGKIMVGIEFIGKAGQEIKINTLLAKKYRKALENLSKEIGLKNKMPGLEAFIKFPDIITSSARRYNMTSVLKDLKIVLISALKNLSKSRGKEGKKLKGFIKKELDNIRRDTRKIEKRLPFLDKILKNKLKKRVKEVSSHISPLNNNRLNAELGLIMSRSDISEEIARMSVHLKNLGKLVVDKKPVGKKIDFMCQEMNREINTIGSKIGDAVISKQVIDIKYQIEKIKEQIQNIE
jgi:uncharacterized protein (TIGR00255 family)